MIGMLVLYNRRNSTYLEKVCENVLKGMKLTLSKGSEIVLEKTDTTVNYENETFVIALSKDENLNIVYVPATGSVSTCWYKGNLEQSVKCSISELVGNVPTDSEAGTYPAHLLVKLNSSKHENSNDKESNYTQLVSERIIGKLGSSPHALCLSYLTKNSNSKIILSALNRDLYFTLIHNLDFYALVWSDTHEISKTFLDAGAFCYNMTPLSNNGTLVIHPKYLVSKWKKWVTYQISGSHTPDPLRATAMLEKYLSRNTVQMKETT